MFLFRRSDDADLPRRIEALEDAHSSLVRAFEEYRAEVSETVELLALTALPAWLRNDRAVAQATGWHVIVTPKGLSFQRLDAPDHSYLVALPLPDDKDQCEHIRAQLQVRINGFGSQAA